MSIPAHLRDVRYGSLRYRELLGFLRHRKGANIVLRFTGLHAQAMRPYAEAMQRDLAGSPFVIDLSPVVSHYVGETERRLASLFAPAEGEGALLIFDEADALFGARTQVRDAHDRYAGIGVGAVLLPAVQRFGAGLRETVTIRLPPD